MQQLFRSKNELAYSALKAAILKSDLKPGQRLVIDELAAEMGVSQIPIREALRQLESDGFVTSEPYVGARVVEIHAGLVTEIFTLLEALEIISSRAASQTISSQDLAKLEAMIVVMDSLVDDPDRWSQENKRLHLFICQCADMTLVEKMMSTAFDHWDRLRYTYLQDVSGLRIALAQQQHHHILAGLIARNAQAIERVIRDHNQAALAAYVQHLRAGG